MADMSPDLVLRAAARLAKAGGAQPLSGERSNMPEASRGTPEIVPALPQANPRRPQNTSAQRIVSLSPTAMAANGLVLPSAGFSRSAEEFRSIKRQLLANAAQKTSRPDVNSGRMIMVTSAAPGEGKTYTSINLALSIAFERDLRVLLIDADAHRQSMLSYLGISADSGWLDLLEEDKLSPADVMLGTNIPNLSVLPAGKTRPEIPELMSSRKMAELLKSLMSEDPDRIIILDSLPALVSAEPAILASLVGQCLFVVAASSTARQEVDAALRLLEACPSVSLILNKGNPLLVDELSQYGYGYYYRGGK